MPKIAYEAKKFGAAALQTIQQANSILVDYAQQGFDLTLRQLYYQFVARDLFANIERNYKRLGKVVNDARLAGYIDWKHITDRTRNLAQLRHWNDPADIIDWASKQFRTRLWETQPNYVEVWIEKDALVGVIQRTCQEMDVPYFSCRGYTSQSEMWGAGQRLLKQVLAGKNVTILHLGDHDPSGIDMTRDIRERLHTFIWQDFLRAKVEEEEIDEDDQDGLQQAYEDNRHRFTVKRIALNMDQIDQYDPPPNPAKISDSRYRDYALNYGEESWELDALEPTVLAALVRDSIEEEIDEALWDEAVAKEAQGTRRLRSTSGRWQQVESLLDGKGVMLPPDMAQRIVELGELSDDDLSWLTDQVDEQEEDDDEVSD